MKPSGTVASAVLALSLLSVLAAGSFNPRERSGMAAPEVQSTFPRGAVVSLQGTPHLFIADAAGILHWGGDTRALRRIFVDWGTRISVSLETLRTLRRGDPYLSAGLLKDGDPIYLVKWETEEAVPRLLHIKCIVDVELFGINESNYGRFVIDRTDWEAEPHQGIRLRVSSLQKADLPAADPTAARCQAAPPTRPHVGFAPSDITPCAPALGGYGLAVGDVNIARTVTLALPPSVVRLATESPAAVTAAATQQDAVVAQIAPLMRASSQTSSDLLENFGPTAMGVLKFTRGAPTAGTSPLAPGGPAPGLPAHTYVVAMRGGAAPGVIYTSCDEHVVHHATSAVPSMRQIASRDVVPPQAIITSDAFCYSWNRVQVCTGPSPRDAMTPSEQMAMNQVMNESVARLVAAGRLQASDINTSAALPDLEGVEAVNRRQASMLAAPANPAPAGVTSASPVVGALHVDLEVVIPSTTIRLPPGDYVVRVRGSGANRIAELTSVTNQRYQMPVANVEVLGNATQPEVALVNLVFIFPPDQLCFFFEC